MYVHIRIANTGFQTIVKRKVHFFALSALLLQSTGVFIFRVNIEILHDLSLSPSLLPFILFHCMDRLYPLPLFSKKAVKRFVALTWIYWTGIIEPAVGLLSFSLFSPSFIYFFRKTLQYSNSETITFTWGIQNGIAVYLLSVGLMGDALENRHNFDGHFGLLFIHPI